MSPERQLLPIMLSHDRRFAVLRFSDAYNYIARLQEELAGTRAALAAQAEAIQEFQVHLAGDKFAGFEADGGRKDWIAVADVNAWLARIVEAGA